MSKEIAEVIPVVLTPAQVRNDMIKTVKKEFPVGQHFMKKNCDDKTVFKVDDHTPAGIVLAFKTPKSPNATEYSTIPYAEFFAKMDDLQKVEVATINLDDEKLPHVWNKKVVAANAVIRAMIDTYAKTLDLDPEKIQDREQIYKKVRNFMNVEYVPKFFKSAICEIVVEKKKLVLWDAQGPHEIVVDQSQDLHIGMFRKEKLMEKWNAAQKTPEKPKALVNKHDVQKIKGAKSKKAKSEPFKVGAKYIFVKTLNQFCVLETLKITKIDRKKKMVTLESTSDTQLQPVVTMSFDELLSLLKDYVLIYKNNLLTKKLRDAKVSSKQLEILLSVVKKAKGEK